MPRGGPALGAVPVYRPSDDNLEPTPPDPPARSIALRAIVASDLATDRRRRPAQRRRDRTHRLACHYAARDLPLVRPRSMPMLLGAAQSGVSRRTQPECRGSTSDTDQIDGRSGEASHLTLPPSIPDECPLAGRVVKCAVFASSATLLPPQWRLVCCIERLNPPPEAAIQRSAQ